MGFGEMLGKLIVDEGFCKALEYRDFLDDGDFDLSVLFVLFAQRFIVVVSVEDEEVASGKAFYCCHSGLTVNKS